MEKQYLFININGSIKSNEDSYHIELIAMISNSGCNIEKVNFDKTFNVLSGFVLISGKWNEIALLEKKLEKFLEVHDVNLDLTKPKLSNDKATEDKATEDKATEDKATEDKETGYIPYEIKVVNVDEVGIVNKFIDFLAYQDIDIESLHSELYSSKYGADLLKLNIKVKIPSNLNIISLREQFDIMCYDESFDATFKVSTISS